MLSAALACFLHLLVIVQYIILCLWHIKLRNSIKDYILLKYCFDKYPRGCVRSSSSGCLTLKVCTALWELAHGEFGWLRQSIDFVSQPSSEHPSRPCISVTRYLPLTFTQLSLDKQVEWVAFFSLSAVLKVQVCISVRPIRLSRLEAYVSYNTAALGNTTGQWTLLVEISRNTHFRDTTSHHTTPHHTTPQL